MANLDFFAAESDQRAVVDFLFTSTNVRLFESYSEFSQELREFRSLDELAAAFPLGVDKHGNGTAILLQLWSPSVMTKLEIERFALKPEKCNGHTFRHRIVGGGLIQLYLGGVHGRVITKSHFGHFAEAGARKWGVEKGVNWSELKTLSNKVQYHIRKRLAAAKVPGRPVLPEALELVRAGYSLKEAAQTSWQYTLE
ncbi:MAG: hypothetical protein IAF94_10100 [Pirellulaceae bacterium]|nr:hypothetical protein [Pirellulaceae bacterium]